MCEQNDSELSVLASGGELATVAWHRSDHSTDRLMPQVRVEDEVAQRHGDDITIAPHATDSTLPRVGSHTDY